MCPFGFLYQHYVNGVIPDIGLELLEHRGCQSTGVPAQCPPVRSSLTPGTNIWKQLWS